MIAKFRPAVAGFFVASSLVALSACGTVPGQSSQPPATGAKQTPASTPAQPGTPKPNPSASGAGGTGVCDYVLTGEAAKQVSLPKFEGVLDSGTAAFVIKTNEGDITITMDRSKAPCTVNSFESLAQQGYFDNTACHRLVDGGIFVLQCGDPSGTGSGGPGYSFADELDSTETYGRGVVAMANGGPNTNGSQFFLVYDDSPLEPHYTVFGQMDEASTNVVARISIEGQDGTNPSGGGKPNNPAQIISVKAK